MLQKFSVENYKNFRKKLEIDFSDVNGYKFSNDCISDGTVSKMIIYGKNGCGKTNLGYALCDLKRTLGSGTYNKRDSFISNADSDLDITLFSYTFLLHEKKDIVTYEYQKCDASDLVCEKMIINEHVIYEYDFSNRCFKEADLSYFHNEDSLRIYSDHSNSTLTFLQWCVNNGSVDSCSEMAEIFKFASKITQIFTPTTASIQLSKAELEELNNHIRDLENFFDFMGISCHLTMEKLPDGTKELYFIFDNRKVSFLENASSGTLSLFNFYILFLMPHKESSLLYFDEFDAFFHFELSEKIVQYIKNRYRNSLVIFTTHNTNLMTNKIMRPDTLFILTEKGKLVSLCNATDRELREGHNLAKLYMNGEFHG